jgi:hypothetical protein
MVGHRRNGDRKPVIGQYEKIGIREAAKNKKKQSKKNIT